MFHLKKKNNNLINLNYYLKTKIRSIKGLIIVLKGRLSRKGNRKKKKIVIYGTAPPFNSLKENIEFAQNIVFTRRGSYGIKVWVHYSL